MSSGSRKRFNAQNPLPAEGVTLPDVFPSPIQKGYDRLGLHDILEGRIPHVKRGQTSRAGWLRIAFGNGQNADYTSPHMSPSEQQQLRTRAAFRTLEIDVDIEETSSIARVTNIIVEAALEPPRFNGHKFEFPGKEDGILVANTPAEPAIAFIGIASIKGAEARVSGIHFPSDGLRGWVHIGEEPEPLEPAA